MNKDLTCNQVSALINFYIQGKLNPRLKEYVDLHIEKCPACRKKINELKKILKTFNTTSKPAPQVVKSSVHPEFLSNLSAYVDNELNSNENIKIKKMAISNPSARRELESMYKFQRFMQSAYEKTKNDIKFDYSKHILSEINSSEEYSTTYFYKLASIFVLLLIAIITGFIYLYF